MKNLFTLLFFCCLFSSCTEDNNQATLTPSTAKYLASKPEANSKYDESYKGIYKGIITGNISGALYINIFNDDTIWAKFLTNSEDIYVLQNVPLSEGDGKTSFSELRKFRFSSENVSFEITLDETGNNITVSDFNFYLENNLSVCLIKEKSNSLIKCYTGNFSGHDEYGSVNFTSDGELKIKGLSKKLNSKNVTNVIGEISVFFFDDDGTTKTANGISPSIQYQINANLHHGQIFGYLDRNSLNGNWMYDNKEIGDWSATRIL